MRADGDEQRAADEATFREEYEHLRADGATFAIALGHSSTGEVVEQHERYAVVRKTDEGGALVRSLDPRKERA
jgi:hypothetical protein